MEAWSGSRARIAAITESATLAVDAKAKALQAAGEDVIGFGAGEPDFPTPEHIVEAAVAACRDPRNHHYTPDAGPARAARRDRGQDRARLRRRRRRRARCSSPTAASTRSTTRSRCCSTPATRCSCPRRTGPPIPRRSRSPAACRSCCPRPRGDGFRVTVEQLEAARTPRTKALLFVSPSNPTGAVYPPDEVEAIGRWAVEHGIWVVTDEIYEHLTYGDHEFTSMPALVPELADTLRRAQRCRQDLRDDRVARRLDDRAAPTSSPRRSTCSRTRRRTSPNVAQRGRARGGAAATSTPSRRCATRSSGAAG